MSELLQFEQVNVTGEDYDFALQGFDLTLWPGDWVVISTAEKHRTPRLPLMDAAQGLVRPAAGRVLFQGEDWTVLPPDRQAERRSRMGRVFQRNFAWLSNLDVDENITLRLRHRGDAPDEVLAEASDLVCELGLAEIPQGRPVTVERETLQTCQWVRALLGSPPLLLADYPGDSLGEACRERVFRAVSRRCASGMAALWLCHDHGAWSGWPAGVRHYVFDLQTLALKKA